MNMFGALKNPGEVNEIHIPYEDEPMTPYYSLVLYEGLVDRVELSGIYDLLDNMDNLEREKVMVYSNVVTENGCELEWRLTGNQFMDRAVLKESIV